MTMNNFIEELKMYFENTPKEEILKVWNETAAEFDGIGITVEELLSRSVYQYILPDNLDIGSRIIASNNFNPEFSSGFFVTHNHVNYAKSTQSCLPKAAFSLTNYIFDKVSIDLTDDSGKELVISFEPNGLFRINDMSFELVFKVNISVAGMIDPFIEIRCRGDFKFQNVTDLNTIPEFFYNNSIAILFPYVRAYISVITTQANIPGIILPTLNLSSLGEELKRNTSQE